MTLKYIVKNIYIIEHTNSRWLLYQQLNTFTQTKRIASCDDKKILHIIVI